MAHAPLFACGCLSRRHVLRAVTVGAGSLVLASCAKGLGPVGQVFEPSNDQLSEMGVTAWRSQLKDEPRSTDARRKAQVDLVAKRIITASGLGGQYNWEVALFASDQINAFALPGGKIGVYEGLFKTAKTDAQLAAVLGHEITHVKLRHAAKRIGQARAGQLGVALATVGLQAGGVQGADQLGSLLGAGVQLGAVLPFTRNQESEADSGGLQIMAAAAYDPNEAVTLWRNMAASGKGSQPEILSTHPADQTRIQAIAAQVPSVMPIYEQARKARG